MAQPQIVNPTPVWADMGWVAFVASSGNVAAATATATQATPGGGRVNYVTGIMVTSSGSTGAAVVEVTLTGLVGGTLTFNYATVAGATTINAPLVINFPIPLQAIAATAVVLSMPSLGAGNTNATLTLTGFATNV